jgi:hypothetical protein
MNSIETVSIGSNVTIGPNSISRNFAEFYNNNGKKAGIYTLQFSDYTWSYKK